MSSTQAYRNWFHWATATSRLSKVRQKERITGKQSANETSSVFGHLSHTARPTFISAINQTNCDTSAHRIWELSVSLHLIPKSISFGNILVLL